MTDSPGDEDELLDFANERLLLGAILVKPAIFIEVEEELVADDFADPWHGALWKAFKDATDTGEPITLKRAMAALGGDVVMQGDVTLSTFLARLIAEASLVEDFRSIGRYLRELAAKRRDEPGYEISPSDYPPRSYFGALQWEDLDKKGQELEYLIDEWLTRGDLSVMAGPSKSGKSFLAIGTGMLIALGATELRDTFEEWFGLKILFPGLVVYQAGEGSRGVKKRLRAFRKQFNVPADMHVPFVLLTKPLDLYRGGADPKQSDTLKLIEECRAWQAYYDLPLAMVVIDTLATATAGADENSAKDMTHIFSNCNKLKEETGAAVCLVHHMTKGGGAVRGHSSIYANADQVILVARDAATGIRTGVLDKQKDGEDGKVIHFELKLVEMGVNEKTGKPVTSCVVLDVGEKDKEKLAKRRGEYMASDRERVFLKAYFTALREGAFEKPPGDFKGPVSVERVVTVQEIKTRFSDELWPVQDDSARHDAKVRQAMSTAGAALVKFNVIGRDRRWIWWNGRPVRGMPQTRQQEILDLAESHQPLSDDVSEFLAGGGKL